MKTVKCSEEGCMGNLDRANPVPMIIGCACVETFACNKCRRLHYLKGRDEKNLKAAPVKTDDGKSLYA